MIFKGEDAPICRRQRKLTLWEMNMVGPMQLQCLRWSKMLITYDHAPSPDHFPLVVNPIIGRTHLTKVLMDGGSSLNIL